MGVKEDYEEWLQEQSPSLSKEYQDYLQAHPLPQQAPNPKKEAITGSQRPRQVGIPEGMIETGLEAVGSMLGGTGGAALLSPLGPGGALAGGVTGSGVGLAATRATIEGIKGAFGSRPMPSLDELQQGSGQAFLEGAAGELGFRGLAAIPQAKHALAQRLLGGTIAPEERALYGEAQRLGIHLTPSKLTDSKAPKLVENTLRRTISGGEKFQARDIENELSLRRAVDTWADETLGKFEASGDPAFTNQELGKTLQTALEGKVIPQYREMTQKLYANLDRQTGDAKIVDMKDAYQELTKVRTSLASKGDVYKNALATLDEALSKMSQPGPSTGLTVKQVFGKAEEGQPASLTGLKVREKSKAAREPITVTFQDAQNIRSIIGEDLSRGTDPLPKHDQRAIQKAYALLSESMSTGATAYSKATGKDINLSWLLADTMSRRGKELFNESIVAKVIERNPEKVVETVFKPNAITETRDLVRALEMTPTALNAYRRGVVEKLIHEATDPATERVVGTTFAKAARKRGEGVLKETFGETYKNFTRILEIAERLPKEGEKSGMLWFEQGLYISGLLGAAGGHALDSPLATAAAVGVPAGWFIGTRHLANILTSPEATNKLLSTWHMDPRSKALGRTLAQLGAIEIGETGFAQPQGQAPRRGLMTSITERLAQ